MEKALPAIPAKRYFTIGEVSELCGVKPYVLRYWEQEFTQLKPMKRRGNRRYYQHHEVLLIRRIRDLLYDQGFTISGARNRLSDVLMVPMSDEGDDDDVGQGRVPSALPAAAALAATSANGHAAVPATPSSSVLAAAYAPAELRAELLSIRELLSA